MCCQRRPPTHHILAAKQYTSHPTWKVCLPPHNYCLSLTLTLPTLPSPSPHPPFSYFTLYPNGSLALNLVNQSLEGVYMCNASNPGGVATLSHDVDVKGTLSVLPTTHL